MATTKAKNNNTLTPSFPSIKYTYIKKNDKIPPPIWSEYAFCLKWMLVAFMIGNQKCVYLPFYMHHDFMITSLRLLNDDDGVNGWRFIWNSSSVINKNVC